jgi:16S rRNA processing protein RimM
MPTVETKPSPEGDAPWVALAVFTQPHGVSGRIKVKSFTEPADDFARHPDLTDANGTPVKLRITGHAQGMPIVEIEGVTKREQAELLRGRKLGVARTQMPALTKPNAYYTDDLIGMAVVTLAGEPFGRVARVTNYGASDILDIERGNGVREMYAFTHATFPTVDVAARRITIDPPELLNATHEDN